MINKFYSIAVCCFITLLLIVNGSRAQNLVPNGNFETIRGCSGISPFGIPDYIDSAAYWVSPTLGFSDYYSPCTGSAPDNEHGHQLAHSGESYAGMYIWVGLSSGTPNFRDYMSVPLTATLVAGSEYHFEMYANLATFYYHVTTNSIGALFTPSAVSVNTQNSLPDTPQVSNTTGYITDTTNWVLIQGNFVAAGGERFLTIGNFKNYAATDSLVLYPASMSSNATYIYIDDISVTKISTGIDNINNHEDVTLFPNPATDYINIRTASNEPETIVIYEITGRKLLVENYTNNTSVDLTKYKNGIYFYEIMNKQGFVKKGNFIKE